MNVVLDVASGVLLTAAVALTAIASLGLLRMPDAYTRMHTAAKPPTLAILLAALGAALQIADLDGGITKLAIVVVLQFLTGPAGAHLLSRAAHRGGLVPVLDRDDPRDDLASGAAPTPTVGD